MGFGLKCPPVCYTLPVTQGFENFEASNNDPFPLPDIDERGVDLSQIRRQLALTPSQRLRMLETFLVSIIQIRRGIRRPPVSSDPFSSR